MRRQRDGTRRGHIVMSGVVREMVKDLRVSSGVGLVVEARRQGKGRNSNANPNPIILDGKRN